MKVAVVQLAPGPDRRENVEETIRLLRQAANQGINLVVLPELCTSPYQLADQELDPWAENIPRGETVQRWLSEVKTLNLYLVAGLLEKSKNRYYNSALVLGPSGPIGFYRKAHLFGWERQRLTAGETPFLHTSFQSIGVAVMICYDLRFVEAVRLMALEKVQLLCVPAAWSSIGKRQAWDHAGFCGAAHLALGLAYANGLFVLCASRSGKEGEVRYLGNSLIAGPTGEVLAGPTSAGYRGVVVAEIDPEQARNKEVGEFNHILKDRRTDLYSLTRTKKKVETALDREGVS